jgi:hypothetical protein
VADGLAVDLRSPHHLVLDLDEVSRVEEIRRSEERVDDLVWVGVEAVGLSKRDSLRVGSGLLWHKDLSAQV